MPSFIYLFVTIEIEQLMESIVNSS